ncbi:hypothetical protein BST43_22085 [Mycobacteroides saopaulense]|uniref:YcaO domain-containing protein n=1 Tax=Mycobacteroides saopaulense TaxID=1578165 RepID=A0A1X0IQL7_9MYCO|nr:YcaO-like family protein [Mycobacteroides saopaulense]ORB50621.1 hypothetical protein BST43_22085 [Mycobacteroides saopaulense]
MMAQSNADTIFQYGERVNSLSTALTNGLLAVSELGLSADLEKVQHFDGAEVWCCHLRGSASGRSESFGLGKGAGLSAQAGALYESIEHYFSARLAVNRNSIQLRSPDDLTSGPLGYDSTVLVFLDEKRGKLSCQKYECLISGQNDQYLPIALTSPGYVDDEQLRSELGDSYDYEQLSRYCSSTGWASGATVEEATLHALNEIIERDAQSHLLINQFLMEPGPPLIVVDRSTAPLELKKLWSTVEESLNDAVHLIEITTDLGVPAFVAHSTANFRRDPRIHGAGASLSPLYAAERALFELLQMYAAVENSILLQLGVDFVPRALTDSHGILKRASQFNLTDRLSRAMHVSFPNFTALESPAEHLSEVLDRLNRHGYLPYRFVRYCSARAAVVDIIVPGLERFFLVQSGVPVLPGPRARMAIARNNSDAVIDH